MQVCYRPHRIRGSDWRLHRHWYHHSALRDLLGTDRVLTSDTLYRCLDKLVAHKRAFFSFLRARWTTLFDARFDVLLYDLTSTYFESDPPFDGKRRFGYSRDKRSDCVQVVIALIVTPDGFPAGLRGDAGQHDGSDHAGRLSGTDRTAIRAALSGVWIMDRGIPTEATLAAMRAGDAPVRYLVGHPQGPPDAAGAGVPGAALAGGAAVGHGQAPRRGGGTLHPGAECPAAAEGTRHAAAAVEDPVATARRVAAANQYPGSVAAQARRRQTGRRPGLGVGRHRRAPSPARRSPRKPSPSACGGTGSGRLAGGRAATCCART